MKTVYTKYTGSECKLQPVLKALGPLAVSPWTRTSWLFCEFGNSGMRYVAVLHLDGASDRTSHKSSYIINVNKFSSYLSEVQKNFFLVSWCWFWVVCILLFACMFIVLCNLLSKATSSNLAVCTRKVNTQKPSCGTESSWQILAKRSKRLSQPPQENGCMKTSCCQQSDCPWTFLSCAQELLREILFSSSQKPCWGLY